MIEKCGGPPKDYVKKKFQGLEIVLKITEAPYMREVCHFTRMILDGRKVPERANEERAGRGIVYYVKIPIVGEVVVRIYQHGGIFGKILGTRFLSPRRFLCELKITEGARKAGVTLLEPVAVVYRRALISVKGVWVSRRLIGAKNLHIYMLFVSPISSLITEIARVIAKMHENGIGHADLNIQNIMVVTKEDGLEVSIIDFDKAFQKNFLSPEERMRQLRRLDRSLLKWLPENSAWRRPVTRLRFAAAYCKVFPEIRPLLKEYIEGFNRYERRYRLGWFLQRLLGGVKKPL